jgi:hypothetical protein
VAGVWTVWAPILVVAAVLAGWAFAVYLRRTTPTERIPLIRWRIRSGGTPGWALGLAAGSSSICILAALKLASGRLPLFALLIIGSMLVSLLVQAALLSRHNQRLDAFQ